MDKARIKVGILGLGAIGSVVATCLQKGADMELCGFNRSMVDEIVVQTEKGEIRHPIACFTQAPVDFALDWLIICLKEYHYAEASHWMSSLIGSPTKVVIIRNGIGLKEPLLPYCSENRILETQIDCPTQRLSGRIFRSLASPRIICPQGELALAFRTLLKDQHIVDLVDDFKSESWKKLCESAAIGALTCLTGETCWIFKDTQMQVLYQDLVAEGIAVAKADGAKIPTDFQHLLLQKLLAYPAEKGSSMLTDRLQGHPIELGAKNGAIVRMGKKYGVATPLNDWVCTLLKFTNNIKRVL